MKVTDKDYYLDESLKEMVDLMCLKLKKRNLDNLLIIDGNEGFGKTNISAAIGYYSAYVLGRSFSHENFFFDLDDMVKFASNNKEQVIIWDEAALGGLASEWGTNVQRKLLKLLMIVRKKKHFFIFNIPRFFKLNEYIIIDRAVGLVHVYSTDGINLGRFTYYKGNALEKLFNDWKKKRKRSYRMFYSLRGRFTAMLGKVIDEEAYDKRKDEAISNINKIKSRRETNAEELSIKLKYKVATLKGVKRKDVAKHFGVGRNTLLSWERLAEKHKNLLED